MMQQNHGANWPVGSVITMFDETLRIRENNGTSGCVETLGGEFVSNKYYWSWGGEKAQLQPVNGQQG